jgi:tetratricopeptide (TPR) repeat protein
MLFSSSSLNIIIRGFAKIQITDNEGALKDFDGALELQPENYGLLNNRANLLMNVFNNQQSAMSDLNKAVELFPEEYVAYKNRGGLRSSLEDYQGSIYFEI